MPDDAASRVSPRLLVMCASSASDVVTIQEQTSLPCDGWSVTRTPEASICRLEFRAHVTHIAELASCIFDESGTSKSDRRSWTQHILRPLREWSDLRGFYDETPFPVSVVQDILSAARSKGAHIPPLAKWKSVLVSEDVLQGSEPYKAAVRWMRWIRDDFEEVGTEFDLTEDTDEHVGLSGRLADRGEGLWRAAEVRATGSACGSATQYRGTETESRLSESESGSDSDKVSE